MTISNFKRTYSTDGKSIPLNSIVLTEEIHLKGLEKEINISPVDSPLCIVRKISDNEYALVTGFRDFISAKSKGLPTISAIIVPDKNRRSFLKSLDMTFEIVETSSLFSPPNWHLPSPIKIKACINKYYNQGILGKKIAVTPKGKILDGYSGVCAARELRLEKIPVYVFSESRWKYLNRSQKVKKST